jgi:hypothetical protein
MSTYALETTKNEIENGYRDLNRYLNGAQGARAVTIALGLAKIDAAELWKFLMSYASTDLNYRDTQHLLVVNSLYNSWVQDPTNTVFIAHAVLTLANATKTRSESVCWRHNAAVSSTPKLTPCRPVVCIQDPDSPASLWID